MDLLQTKYGASLATSTRYNERGSMYTPDVLAERRCVYEYLENDGTRGNKERFVLVLSNNDRKRAKMVSVLFVSPEEDVGEHLSDDCVDIPIGDNRVGVVKCNYVTYIKRSRLGRKTYKVSKHTMKKVNYGIKIALSLENDEHRDEVILGPDYETLYKQLVRQLSEAQVDTNTI